MSSAQKTPFAVTMNQFTDRKIDEANQEQGQSLPCVVTAVNGAIVTVNFQISNTDFTYPPATCPVIGSRYIRIPVQVGDKGICIAADARLGGISGLGLGLAPIGLPSNLGGLVFVPIGNAAWQTIDPNAVVISAPNGSVIQSDDGKSTVTISEGQILMNYSGNQVLINASGISISGTLTINGEPYLSHFHGGVQNGSGFTGGVL